MRQVTLFLLLSSSCFGQAWSGILTPDRAIDWSQSGIPGGIPHRTTVCAGPITPSGDTTGAGDSNTINAAIASSGCTAGQVVQLGVGVFYSAGMTFGTKNNITVRGMGPDKTIIMAVKNYGCVYFGTFCVSGNSLYFSNYPVANTTSWDAGYAKGTSVITVHSTTGLSVCSYASGNAIPDSCPSGSIIILDQRNDAIGLCPQTGGVAPYCAGVSGATESGNIVTIQTAGPHQFHVNDCVAIGDVSQSYTVTGGSWLNGTATLQIGPNNMTTYKGSGYNNNISVLGVASANNTTAANGAGFNIGSPTGSYGAVTAYDNAASVSYAKATDPGAWISGGTVTLQPNSVLYNSQLWAGFGGSTTQLTCTQYGVTKTGWFQIQSVPTNSSFTYQLPATVTGLTPGGGYILNNGTSGRAAVDTGGVFTSEVPDAVVDEHANLGRTCPETRTNNNNQCLAGEISQRDQMEFKRVVAICTSGAWSDGTGACATNTIKIDPPILMTNWRTTQAPGVWWTGNQSVGNGVEDLTIDRSIQLANQQASTGNPFNGYETGIMLVNAYDCWVRNIREIYGDRNHIWNIISSRIDIEDNYFYGTARGQSQSYGVETYNGAALDLIQNNIGQHIPAVAMSGGEMGTVYGYNYTMDTGYYVTTTLLPHLNMNHDFAQYSIAEGNNTNVQITDGTHGNSFFITTFRNRLRGQDTPARVTPIRSVQISSFNRAGNTIGNVMGTKQYAGDGITENPQTYLCTTYAASFCIYMVGYRGEGYHVTDDAIGLNTHLRWGNFDYTTMATAGSPTGTRWCGNSSNTNFANAANCAGQTEMPSTNPAGAYPWFGISFNPIPTLGDTVPLPNSFYLSGPPAFWQTPWGTPGWPANGPDVDATGSPLDTTCPIAADNLNTTICDGIGHKSYQIPAQLCFNNSPIDPAYQQSKPVLSPGITWQTLQNQSVATVYFDNSVPGDTTGTARNVLYGDEITISGVSPPGFNGTYAVCGSGNGCPSATGMAPTTTSVSYLLKPNPGTYAGGGIINFPNIRLYNAAVCYPTAYSGQTPPPSVVPIGTITGRGVVQGNGVIK